MKEIIIKLVKDFETPELAYLNVKEDANIENIAAEDVEAIDETESEEVFIWS